MSSYNEAYYDAFYERFGEGLPDNTDYFLSETIKYSMAQIVNSVAQDAARQPALVLRAVAQALVDGQGEKNQAMLDMYKRVQKVGQRAMLARYRELFGKSRSYRWADSGKFKRYSNKVLLKALKDESLFRINDTGLRFGNKRFLDQKARQWYRLNFGAGEKGAFRKKWDNVAKIFNQKFEGPNFNNFPNSRPFVMPEGVFTDVRYAKTPAKPQMRKVRRGGHGAAFYPTLGSRHQRRFFPTAGVASGGFLDAGAQAMTREFAEQVEKVILKWLKDAIKNSSGPLGGYLTPTEGQKALNALK